MNVALFGKRVFADIIKLKISRSSWMIWVGPTYSGQCQKEKCRDQSDAATEKTTWSLQK